MLLCVTYLVENVDPESRGTRCLGGTRQMDKTTQWRCNLHLDFKLSPCAECCMLSFYAEIYMPTFRNTLSVPSS